MPKTAKSYTKELIIYGKVKRFPQTMGQNLRLVDGKAVWVLDTLLHDFEDKDICITIKLGKPKKAKKIT